MGNNQSTTHVLKWKLSNALPEYSHSGVFEDKKARPYINEKDREQFIYGLCVVLTNNGKIDLRDHNFALLYSRRGDRQVARVVAEKDGVITAKVDGGSDGKDQNEAFKMLRYHVEMKLDRLLENVPPPNEEDHTMAGPSSPRGVVLSPASPPQRTNVPIDAPPAYGAGDIKSRKG